MDDIWQNWNDRLKSQDLTPEELREFELLMRADPKNIEKYLDELLVESLLESECLPAVSLEAPPQRKKPVIPWPIAALAASVALGFFGYYVGHETRPTRTSSIVVTDFVATVTDSDAAAEALGIRIGKPLPKGELIIPEEARVGIAMRGGARLEVHGPAKLNLLSADRLFLFDGRLSTYAPEYAHGFTIDTKDGRAVDLGTRFVTTAGGPVGTELHVIEGLIDAYTSSDSANAHSLSTGRAVILKDGTMSPMEYLAQRLNVPLNPVLKDSDKDGIADVVEKQYGSDPENAESMPKLLLFEESFSHYAVDGIEWIGDGKVIDAGLNYSNGGKTLKTSGGAMQTNAKYSSGVTHGIKPNTLPATGVVYLSFLIRPPVLGEHDSPYGGLLFHRDSVEEFFAGKLSTSAAFYGSRMKSSSNQDAFDVPVNNQTHLYVIRIDFTRLVTDVFVDPALDKAEPENSAKMRYYDVPDIKSIVLRSGSASDAYAMQFDEIRLGLTWETVLPLAE